jgi:hypothetical protein
MLCGATITQSVGITRLSIVLGVMRKEKSELLRRDNVVRILLAAVGVEHRIDFNADVPVSIPGLC